jgi:excisionase family DNA binding protein
MGYLRAMDTNTRASWLTRNEAADTLKVSRRTVDRLRESGSLDWYRDERSGEVRIERASFERYAARLSGKEPSGA